MAQGPLTFVAVRAALDELGLEPAPGDPPLELPLLVSRKLYEIMAITAMQFRGYIFKVNEPQVRVLVFLMICCTITNCSQISNIRRVISCLRVHKPHTEQVNSPLCCYCGVSCLPPCCCKRMSATTRRTIDAPDKQAPGSHSGRHTGSLSSVCPAGALHAIVFEHAGRGALLPRGASSLSIPFSTRAAFYTHAPAGALHAGVLEHAGRGAVLPRGAGAHPVHRLVARGLRLQRRHGAHARRPPGVPGAAPGHRHPRDSGVQVSAAALVLEEVIASMSRLLRCASPAKQ